jgi:hypothetical protein
MRRLAIALGVLLGAHGYACALDANCTTTTNLGMARCPEDSTDWYESYTDQIDELDALAKTAKSSFTVVGNAFSVGGSTLVVNASSVTVGANLRVNGKFAVGRAPTVDEITVLPSASGRGISWQESDDGNTAGRLAANASRGTLELFNGGVSAVLLSGSADSYVTNRFGIGTQVPCSTCTIHVIGSGTFRDKVDASSFTFHAGASTTNVAASGTFFYQDFHTTLATTTVATPSTQIFSTMTVLANTLMKNGDCIRVVCQGNFAGNTNNKTATLTMGGSTIATSLAVNTSGAFWYLESEVCRDASNHQIVNGQGRSGTAGSAATFHASFGSGSFGLGDTVDQDVKCQCANASASAGDCSFFMMKGEYKPAP